MLETFLTLAQTVGAFVVILSVIVFIHEFGHYIVAKWNGVHIEAFAIGFGKEIFGWTDKSGTRWKFCLFPMGGYVQMFGDENEASMPAGKLKKMSKKDKARSFFYKPLWRKSLVVIAGPAANFLLTIVILTFMITQRGLPSTAPYVGEVLKDSAAYAAGIKKGDIIKVIDGDEVKKFADIPRMIAANLGEKISIVVERGGKDKELFLAPRITKSEDVFGNEVERPLIGIKSGKLEVKDANLLEALQQAVIRTYQICATTLEFLGQMIVGDRGTDDLRGPLGMAELSGQASQQDFMTMLWFIAMLSANLGLVNLLPIPVLDGGHLLMYGVEAVSGPKIAQKVQHYGFMVGIAIIGSLVLLTTFNDISRLL